MSQAESQPPSIVDTLFVILSLLVRSCLADRQELIISQLERAGIEDPHIWQQIYVDHLHREDLPHPIERVLPSVIESRIVLKPTRHLRLSRTATLYRFQRMMELWKLLQRTERTAHEMGEGTDCVWREDEEGEGDVLGRRDVARKSVVEERLAQMVKGYHSRRDMQKRHSLDVKKNHLMWMNKTFEQLVDPNEVLKEGTTMPSRHTLRLSSLHSPTQKFERPFGFGLFTPHQTQTSLSPTEAFRPSRAPPDIVTKKEETEAPLHDALGITQMVHIAMVNRWRSVQRHLERSSLALEGGLEGPRTIKECQRRERILDMLTGGECK